MTKLARALLVAAMLAITAFASAQPSYSDWVREKVGSAPESARTVAYADELARLEADLKEFPLFDILSVIQDGWKGDEAVGAKLDTYDTRFESMRKLVASGPIRLPTPKSHRDPFPQTNVILMVARTCSAEAIRRTETGDIDGAVELCLSIAQLYLPPIASGQHPITQLMSLTGIDLLANTISHVSAAKGFTPDHANRLGSALVAIEARLADAPRLAQVELPRAKDFTADELNNIPYQHRKSEFTDADAADFGRAFQLCAEATAQELAKPFPQRREIKKDALTALLQSPSVQPPIRAELIEEIALQYPHFTEISIRNEVALARIRIACLRCAEIAGVEPSTAWLDPFTGKPFGKTASGRRYSAGPDGILGDGTHMFSGTNGPMSPGDILE